MPDTVSEGEIRISIEGDSNTIVVNPIVYKMYMNPRVREATRSFISPLAEEGIERMDINKQGEKIESIEEGEVGYYDVVLDDSTERTETVEKRLVIIASLSFRPREKWRVAFGDDEAAFFAAMNDQEFMKRVSQRRELFKAGDTMYVKMRVSQWVETGRLKTEREIVKVLRHAHLDEQGELDFGDTT